MPRPSPLPSASRWRAEQVRGEHHDHCSPCVLRLLTPPTRTPSSGPSARTGLSRFILLCVSFTLSIFWCQRLRSIWNTSFNFFPIKYLWNACVPNMTLGWKQVSHVTFSALEICRCTAVFRVDSWSIWPPKFIWLDGFSLLNADSHRLMQIISGLQNFDRSSVASVVTAADKVLMMHLSFNVYYFVLADFFETE